MVKKTLTRAGLVVMIPLIPISILIDIAIGDIMTGVKTTNKAKAIEHYKLFISYWNEA